MALMEHSAILSVIFFHELIYSSANYFKKICRFMVNFALNNGKGIKHGDVVYLASYEASKPLMIEVRKAIIKAGGHIISNYWPDNELKKFNLDRDFYSLAHDHQLD